MFYHLKLSFILASLVARLTAFHPCKTETLELSKNNARDSIVRLGKSRYYITLPDDLTISEARGKEGQLGYSISPKDTASRAFGFIEIKRGWPNGASSEFSKPNEYLPAGFLGKKIMWAIEQTETGYFIGRTPNGKITSWISSNDRKSLVRLIKIFSTVTRK